MSIQITILISIVAGLLIGSFFDYALYPVANKKILEVSGGIIIAIYLYVRLGQIFGKG
jgi:hypothetical protein